MRHGSGQTGEIEAEKTIKTDGGENQYSLRLVFAEGDGLIFADEEYPLLCRRRWWSCASPARYTCAGPPQDAAQARDAYTRLPRRQIQVRRQVGQIRLAGRTGLRSVAVELFASKQNIVLL